MEKRKYVIRIEELTGRVVFFASDFKQLRELWFKKLDDYEGRPYIVQNNQTGELIVGGTYEKHDIAYINAYQE